MNGYDFYNLKPGDFVQCVDSDPVYKEHVEVGDVVEVVLVRDGLMYHLPSYSHSCKHSSLPQKHEDIPESVCGGWRSNSKWEKVARPAVKFTEEELKEAHTLSEVVDLEREITTFFK